MGSLPTRSAAAEAKLEAAKPEAPEGAVARLVHETLQEQIYQELRKAIREGRFMSGQALTVRGLAAMLGVSPMPVREAVRRLGQEKTLEILPNRTMRVPLLSPRRFQELADVRAELEGYAAARAAENMTAADFAEISAVNEEMSRAVEQGDMSVINLMNERFHFSVYRAGGSETLLSVIEGLWQQSGPYLASLIHRLVSGSDMPTCFAQMHHYGVLAALAKRDAQAARETMATDILESARWYRESVPETIFDKTENRKSR